MKNLFPLTKFAKKRVCVALSGGRDSIVLLHFLASGAKKYEISLSALICEHGIRGESARRDVAFVKDLCERWGIALQVVSLDVPSYAASHKMGLEEAGRILRYECFEQEIAGGKTVVTAHHRDDFAETVLFRLLRGTSLAGLDAFPEREGLVRPMLALTRAQIDDYVRENALPYREDESNADDTFTRNFLRNEVLPLLQTRFAGGAENLVRFAERAAQDDKFLSELATEAIVGEDKVPVDTPKPIFSRACIILLKKMGVTRDYTAANIQELVRLQHLQSGKKVTLPCGIEAVREGENVLFHRPVLTQSYEIPFALGEHYLGEYLLVVGEGEKEGALSFDLDSLPTNCVIRVRREGDEITPFGGNRKSLKKFLTEKKISARVGKALPLVALEGEIYAVCGVEISQKIKRTEGTKRRAYLQLTSVKKENE